MGTSKEISNFLKEISEDLPESLESKEVKLFNEFLRHSTTTILKDSDFKKWWSEEGEERKKLLPKMFNEFGIGGELDENSPLWGAFEWQSSMLWRLSRLNDDWEGNLIFFKSFGINDVEKFISKEGLTNFSKDYGEVKEELQDKDLCELSYSLVSTDYPHKEDMRLRVLVLLLYSDFMMSVCKELEVKTEYNMGVEFVLKAHTLSRKVANYNTVTLELV